MKKLSTLLVSLSMLLLSACGGGSDSSKAAVVVMFGDSLTNDRGQWVTPDQLWVEKLKAQVEADGLTAKRSITIVNEGLGGEDSQAALNRLPDVLVQLGLVSESDIAGARAQLHGLPLLASDDFPAVLPDVPGLRERCFGVFEGRTFAEVAQSHPEDSLRWRKRDPHLVFPGGGESLLQLRERIAATVQRLAQQHVGEQIALIAHGGVMDILYRLATQQDLQAPRTWALTNTAINRLLWTPQGLSLVGWGDVRHLAPGALEESFS